MSSEGGDDKTELSGVRTGRFCSSSYKIKIQHHYFTRKLASFLTFKKNFAIHGSHKLLTDRQKDLALLKFVAKIPGGGGGEVGVLPEKLGGGV